MTTYIVSDFHLGEADTERDALKRRRFTKFLQKIEPDCQHLIILGDLFDLWFEYRDLVPKAHLSILFEIKALVDRGVKVTFVCGNHDCWVGDFMAKEIGLTICRDQLVLESELGRVLLLHGDGIAKSDWKYRFIKPILRNRINIALYRLLPPRFAYWLARKVSGGSRHYGDEQPSPEFVREYHEFAQKKFAEGYAAVVCGHIHWPEIVEYNGHFYVNSGDWLSYFTYVRFSGKSFAIASMK